MTDRNFDLDWPHGHVTRDGRKARIICKDRRGDSGNLVALIESPEGIEQACIYYDDGSYLGDEEHNLNLQNAPEPKRRISGWVNVWADKGGEPIPSSKIFATKQEAINNRSNCIACIYVDFEEGEGL